MLVSSHSPGQWPESFNGNREMHLAEFNTRNICSDTFRRLFGQTTMRRKLHVGVGKSVPETKTNSDTRCSNRQAQMEIVAHDAQGRNLKSNITLSQSNAIAFEFKTCNPNKIICLLKLLQQHPNSCCDIQKSSIRQDDRFVSHAIYIRKREN